MKIQGQTLASTALDSQGERLSMQDLLQVADVYSGKRMLLHQRHSMASPALGFVENIRVVEDQKCPGEYRLAGDVTIESGTLDEALKGFSISFTRPLLQREGARLLIYLPYPYYNDQQIVGQLASDTDVTIGKWIKKGADSTAVAVFGATIVFLLKPAWDEVYKELVSPWVRQFLSRHWPLLEKQELTVEHIQLVIYKGHQVEFRFVPAVGKERYCFSEVSLAAGISTAVAKLDAEPRAENPGAVRVVLCYDLTARSYDVSRIEFGDGSSRSSV